MKYPSKLKEGATIGLVRPSSAITKERENACVEKLRKMGYKVKTSGNISTCYGGYMADKPQVRGYWLNEMFADPEVDAVFCVRGGDGSNGVWKYLDLDVIRANPKIFAGYSDITTFHLIFNQLCDMVTFHAPMVSSNMLDNFDPETEKSFFQALNAEGPYDFVNPEGFGLKTMKGGRAEGILTGGNLTLVAASLGTPYEIDCRGRILFLEDVHAHVDSTDRIVMQLANSGKFDDCAGILLGQFTDCINQADESYTMLDMFSDILSCYDIPVMYNLQSGHGFPMMTLPLGASCIMDADKRTVRFIPSGR